MSILIIMQSAIYSNEKTYFKELDRDSKLTGKVDNIHLFEIVPKSIFKAELIDIEQDSYFFEAKYGIKISHLASKPLKELMELRKKLSFKHSEMKATVKKNDPHQIKIKKYHELNFCKDQISYYISKLAENSGQSAKFYFQKYGITKNEFN